MYGSMLPATFVVLCAVNVLAFPGVPCHTRATIIKERDLDIAPKNSSDGIVHGRSVPESLNSQSLSKSHAPGTDHIGGSTLHESLHPRVKSEMGTHRSQRSASSSKRSKQSAHDPRVPRLSIRAPIPMNDDTTSPQSTPQDTPQGMLQNMPLSGVLQRLSSLRDGRLFPHNITPAPPPSTNTTPSAIRIPISAPTIPTPNGDWAAISETSININYVVHEAVLIARGVDLAGHLIVLGSKFLIHNGELFLPNTLSSIAHSVGRIHNAVVCLPPTNHGFPYPEPTDEEKDLLRNSINSFLHGPANFPVEKLPPMLTNESPGAVRFEDRIWWRQFVARMGNIDIATRYSAFIPGHRPATAR